MHACLPTYIHNITLRYVTFTFTFHYITLHYIPFIHTYIHTYIIYIFVCESWKGLTKTDSLNLPGHWFVLIELRKRCTHSKESRKHVLFWLVFSSVLTFSGVCVGLFCPCGGNLPQNCIFLKNMRCRCCIFFASLGISCSLSFILWIPLPNQKSIKVVFRMLQFPNNVV